MKAKIITIITILVCFIFMYVANVNASELGSRTVRRNAYVTILNSDGKTYNITYDVTLKIKSNTNGEYTNFEIVNATIGKSGEWIGYLEDLRVTSVTNHYSNVHFKIKIGIKKSYQLGNYCFGTDTFSFSTAGPYSLEEMPQIK